MSVDRLHPRLSPEPVGWSFSLVSAMPVVPKTWMYIPWIRLDYVPTLIDRRAPTSSLRSTVRGEDFDDDDEEEDMPPTTSKDFLPINQVGPLLHPKHMGTGIVIDTADFTIIGCYKTRGDDADALARLQTDFIRLNFESSERKTEIEDLESQTASLPAKKQRTHKASITRLRTKNATLEIQKKRVKALIADQRPYRIAVHEKGVLELGLKDAAVKNLRDFDGQFYAELYDAYTTMAGEAYDENIDKPFFMLEEERMAKEAETTSVTTANGRERRTCAATAKTTTTTTTTGGDKPAKKRGRPSKNSNKSTTTTTTTTTTTSENTAEGPSKKRKLLACEAEGDPIPFLADLNKRLKRTDYDFFSPIVRQSLW